MSLRNAVLLLLFCLFLFFVSSASIYNVTEIQVLSEQIWIQEIHLPLKGPTIKRDVLLPDKSHIVYFSAETFETEDASSIALGVAQPTSEQPYVCHAWAMPPLSMVPLTISQGMNEMVVPDGYGIPVKGHEPVQLSLQVENLKRKEVPLSVFYRFTVRYTTDQGINSLHLDTLSVTALGLDKVKEREMNGNAEHAGHAEEMEGHSGTMDMKQRSDVFGWERGNYEGFPLKEKTGAFFVPPGYHVFEQISLPLSKTFYQNCKIIFIKTHLHVYAKSVSLFDLTTNETLFTARTKHAHHNGELLLVSTDFYSSPVGIKINASHSYGMRTEYNNTGELTMIGMAVLRVFFAK